MRGLRQTITVMLCATLAGCVMGPDYQRPDTGDTARFSDTIAISTGQLTTDDVIDNQWWNAFSDPMLSDLVERAIVANTDIRAATARVEEARAARRIALGAKSPSIAAESSAGRTRQSERANLPPGIPTTFSLFDVGLTATWELDFFGRLQRGIESADAQFEATLEDRRRVLQVVLAEVALNYADMRSAQAQLVVAQQNTDLARETLRLTELLRNQELARELDVIRARAEVTELIAAQADFSAKERGAAARLAVLIGQPPGNEMHQLMAPSHGTLAAPHIPVGLPSELLRRRADVRAAERRLAAASADIGAQVADLFPRFQLTGGYGTTAVDLADLFTSPSEAWNIAGLLYWPLFDGGKRRAAVGAAEARYDGAFAAYDAAVLNALGDAETAFASYVFATKELEALRAARSDRMRALELSRLRFDAELDDLFPVLDAQRRLLSLETRIAAAARAEIIAAINVYRALGGGWQAAESSLPLALTN